MIMKPIIKERGTGKTKEIMKLASENNGAVVVFNEKERLRIIEKAYYFGYKIEVYTYKDLLERRIQRDKPIYIDELSYFLEYIHGNIAGFTLSQEDLR